MSGQTYSYHKGNSLAGSSLANGVGWTADNAKVTKARATGNYII